MNRSNLLFLHPVGLDFRSSSWAGLPPHQAISMPGHGPRRRSRLSFELGDVADEIAGWIHEPVHVIGQSMGGMVALHLALEHPELVQSLVLSCTTSRTPTDILNQRAVDTETRGRAWILNDTMGRWFTEEALSLRPRPEAIAYAEQCLSDIDVGSLADTWRALANHDVFDRLYEIGVPTTCIAGLYDRSTPPPTVREIADGIPTARYVELAAPHMAHLETPMEFAAAVNEHLEWSATRAPLIP